MALLRSTTASRSSIGTARKNDYTLQFLDFFAALADYTALSLTAYMPTCRPQPRRSAYVRPWLLPYLVALLPLLLLLILALDTRGWMS